VLIVYLSSIACTSWRLETLTPQAVVQREPLELLVTRSDSSQVRLTQPHLQGDTIVGLGPQNTEVRVPGDSVLLTHTRRTDAVKTVLAVVGVGVGLFAVAVIGFVIHCNQTACFDLQR
jgi:hypothetical protein